MDSQQPPLTRLPLHLVSNVLTQLENTRQLSVAVRSHRIFNDAFRDDPTIPQRLVKNRIPGPVLPFAIAVLESTPGKDLDGDAARGIFARLEANILGTEIALGHYSPSDLEFLTTTYAAVEELMQAMANEELPVFVDKLGLDHHVSNITEQEATRLGRAFLRYQLMCNLFCFHFVERPRSVWYHLRLEAVVRDIKDLFFSAFSPWVNEQLFCVYEYLQRKVTRAFVDVAAHNVEWVDLGISIQDESWARRGHTPWFLTQGLPCLASIVRATTYDQRLELFDSMPWKNQGRYEDPGRILERLRERRVGFFGATAPQGPTLLLEQLGQLGQPHADGLSRPLDGEFDSAASCPFRLWYIANAVRLPASPGQYTPGIAKFRGCGYVMWDCDLTEALPEDLHHRFADVPEPLISTILQDMSGLHRHRLVQGWKNDIRQRGGKGYWPTDGVDFGRIRGLTEDDERQLMEKWRPELEEWEKAESSPEERVRNGMEYHQSRAASVSHDVADSSVFHQIPIPLQVMWYGSPTSIASSDDE